MSAWSATRHYHVCEHCGVTFSHSKAAAQRSPSPNECHRCPGCGRFANAPPLPLKGVAIDYPDWLGREVGSG